MELRLVYVMVGKLATMVDRGTHLLPSDTDYIDEDSILALPAGEVLDFSSVRFSDSASADPTYELPVNNEDLPENDKQSELFDLEDQIHDVPAESTDGSGLTTNEPSTDPEIEEALRTAGLLSDSPPNSPHQEAKGPVNTSSIQPAYASGPLLLTNQLAHRARLHSDLNCSSNDASMDITFLLREGIRVDGVK
ncbi:hypothetical protein AAG906_006568 [Vitis piasezkii]